LIQLAWLWLRNQPHSALTLWFHERVSRNGGRLRKTTIVALARKAAGRALEICNRRCRDRRRRNDGCLTNILTEPRHLPGPDQSWRIQVDEPKQTMA